MGWALGAAAAVGVMLFYALNVRAALQGGHEPFSFTVFQYYRIVHNHLHHWDLTQGLPMIHPALDGEPQLWSSALTPGYHLYLTTWCWAFGLSVESLRMASLCFNGLALLATLFLGMKLGLRSWPLVTLVLMAPLVTYYTISVESTGLFFHTLVLALLVKPEKGSPRTLLGVAFVGTFFSFILSILLLLQALVMVMLDRLSDTNSSRLIPNGRTIVYTALGCALSMTLGLVHQIFFTPDGAMPLSEYLTHRGEHRSLGGVTDPLFAITRMFSFVSDSLPAFVLLLLALGAFLFHPARQEQGRKEKLVFSGLTAYLLFTLLFSKTSAWHPHYLDHFFFLSAAFVPLVFTSRPIQENWSKCVGAALILVLVALTLQSHLNWWRKFKPKGEVEAFLEKLSPNDTLVRDTSFGTWPLHFQAPEKTLFLESVFLLTKREEERRFLATTRTSNTIFHLEQLHSPQRLNFPQGQGVHLAPEPQTIPDQGRLFLITAHDDLSFERVAEQSALKVYLVLDRVGVEAPPGTAP